jgi:hypothetical protein
MVDQWNTMENPNTSKYWILSNPENDYVGSATLVPHVQDITHMTQQGDTSTLATKK